MESRGGHDNTAQLLSWQEKLKQAEEELEKCRKSQMDAFAIGDAISDGIYVVDSEGIIIDVNRVFLQLTGLDEADVIGKHTDALVKDKYISKATCLTALEENVKVSDMSIMIKTNKKVLVTSNPFVGDDGKVTKVLTVMRDITELIKLKDRLEYSEQVSQRYFNELEYLRKQQYQNTGLVGNSPAMISLKNLVYQVAKVDSTVLVSGETGVGKEVLASEIHKNSLRQNGPYIKVNCAAIPESLLESELFGYEKGAFTGALGKDKPGLFEVANRGTILLDEIGDMPQSLQSKMLRVLQEKEVVRVGGTTPIKLDVRVIATTNRNLEDIIKSGKFREDLYYRLNVIPVTIPPLRSRRQDIPLLIAHFLQKHSERYGTSKAIDPEAQDILRQYDWPGNVRELENLIERLAVVVQENVISRDHVLNVIDNKRLFSAYVPRIAHSLREAVDTLEKQMIQDALKKHGSTHKAARSLGVSQPTLIRKAKLLSIDTSRRG